MCGSTNIYAKFLYYLAKIFGLAPFQLMDNRLSCKSSVDKLCSIINIILFFFGILIVVMVNLKMQNDYVSNVLANGDLFASTVKNLGIITCMVIFILQRENIIKIVDLFFGIDGTFKSLGVKRNCEEVFKVRARFIMAWMTVLIIVEITSGIVFVNETQQTDFLSILHHIIVKSFGNLIQHYVVIIFTTIMVNVNDRLKLINSSLSNVHRFVQKESEICVGTSSTASEIEVDFEILNNIKKIEIIYDMLCDLIDGTIKLFSLPLLIIIAVCFSIFLLITYRFYEIGRDFRETENFKSVFAALIVSLIPILMALNLFAIAFVCTRAQTLVSTANPAAATKHENKCI